MDLAKYEQFKELEARGLRKQAKAALHDFVHSCENDEERRAWTEKYLTDEMPKHRVRHELFEHIIFPVLLAEYHQQNTWATLWLAKLIQNLYNARFLHEAVGYKTENQLLRECFTWDSTNQEVRKLLLRSQIRWSEFCDHEYPSGILYGMNGATLEDCQVLHKEVEFTRNLDDANSYTAYLQEFEEKLDEYEARLVH